MCLTPTHALIGTRYCYCTLAGQVLDVAEEEARQLQGMRYATKRNNERHTTHHQPSRVHAWIPFATRHVPRPSWGVPGGGAAYSVAPCVSRAPCNAVASVTSYGHVFDSRSGNPNGLNQDTNPRIQVELAEERKAPRVRISSSAGELADIRVRGCTLLIVCTAPPHTHTSAPN